MEPQAPAGAVSLPPTEEATTEPQEPVGAASLPPAEAAMMEPQAPPGVASPPPSASKEDKQESVVIGGDEMYYDFIELEAFSADMASGIVVAGQPGLRQRSGRYAQAC